MEFYTAFNQKRPVRLSEETRRFAMESLHGKYGDLAMETPFVAMDAAEGFAEMTPQEQYDAAVMQIAREAPVRVCAHESVSGAATLGSAISHVVPAFFRGAAVCSSVSHLTLDFPTVLFRGVDSLESELLGRLREPLGPGAEEQLRGMENAVRAMRVWHGRYLDALKEQKPENLAALERVPFRPARNFREAVQSLWFTFAFVRLCGNWPGIGRLDEMLGGFLKRDLESGAITLGEAREYLAGMFIKGCEWIRSGAPRGSGDAQHYQNIVLGGIDENGREVTNEVTYLVLDIVEELGISDFPITVRVGAGTPPELLTRAAEVIRHGGGIVAVYNEALILRSLTKFGYPEREARKFANDGCWEVQIPGKTCFTYVPFDGLAVLLNDTLKLNTDRPSAFGSFGELYEAYRANLKAKVESIYRDSLGRFAPKAPDRGWEWLPSMPCSVVSLFEQGCAESGRSYLGGGPRWTVVSPHIGGAPDTGNCLYAIDRLVFREKKATFPQLTELLKNNWEGGEALRRYVSSRYVYYGNDCDESDAYTVKVLNDFADMAAALNGRCPILYPAGVSTFGRQIEWAPNRQATPFGTRKGAILSGNDSPTPGTDVGGATASIKSYAKADLKSRPAARRST